VTVTDGFSACSSSVPIKLQLRSSSGRWQTIDRSTTSATGTFRATLAPGRYRIVAKKLTLQAGDACLKAVSPSLNWV
jgi:hypothetical protein